jgi:F0F1-type ATP synthase membrane subunit b/b'
MKRSAKVVLTLVLFAVAWQFDVPQSLWWLRAKYQETTVAGQIETAKKKIEEVRAAAEKEKAEAAALKAEAERIRAEAAKGSGG